MSDSDSDESPSTVSFKQSRSEFENFDNVVKDFLKERKNATKVKRRTKDEVLKKQSLIKKQKRLEPDASTESELQKSDPFDSHSDSRLLPASVLASLTDKASPICSTESDGVEEVSNRKKSTGIIESNSRKEYKKLNIKVEALNQLNQQRVDSALSFRSKRLTKVHRESVNVNAIHQQKLSASGQDLPQGKIYL